MKAIIAIFIMLTFVISSFGSGKSEKKNDESNVRTITHKFGESTIQGIPERIISIGYSEHDTILALGVIPIALRDWYGEMPFAVWPWSKEYLASAEPLVLPASELDFEVIASLAPDVIFGISSGMSQEEYDLLSQIAPVIAQPAEYAEFATPWQIQTRILAKVLSKEVLAESIINNLENRFTEIKSSNPQFHDKTAAVAFVYQNQPGVYASFDSRCKIIEQLGFKTPPLYDKLAGDNYYVTFSEERLDLLETDVILWISSSDESLVDIRNLPLRKNLKAYNEGRELLLGEIIAGAFLFTSPTSINYLLDNLIAPLKLALDGDPNTKVPSNFQ